MNLRKATRLATGPWCWRALLRGVAAGVEHTHLRAACGALRTVVDIGANRGQFALAARRCFPGARIHSFEPLPEAARIFESLFKRDGAVTLHRVAIGPTAGRGLLHVAGRDDSSSLLEITRRQAQEFPGTAEVATLCVTIQALEDVLSPSDIERPALLKLDVQGYELASLRGCLSRLMRFDYVYVELSFHEFYRGQALADEVIDFLRSHGLRLRGVYNVGTDAQGSSLQADFLFAREVSGV